MKRCARSIIIDGSALSGFPHCGSASFMAREYRGFQYVGVWTVVGNGVGITGSHT